MRYVAAYLLAALGGSTDPTEKDIKVILGSVGVDFDATLAKKVVDELSGKNLAELIAEGQEKLASVPSGGGAVAAAPSAAATDQAAATEKKAEKVESEEEESDEDMGFGLFD